MPGTPLIARSSVINDDSTSTCADAPGYARLTITRGGEMSGNCEIGLDRIARMPTKTVNTASTIASTGRWMNFKNMRMRSGFHVEVAPRW